MFKYGGCEGNGNNFRTEAECMYSCKTPGKQKGKLCLIRNLDELTHNL